MQVVSLPKAQNNLDTILDSVYLENKEIIIQGNNNEQIVIIPYEQYKTLRQVYSCDHIEKTGFHSQSFVKDDEDYSKW